MTSQQDSPSDVGSDPRMTMLMAGVLVACLAIGGVVYFKTQQTKNAAPVATAQVAPVATKPPNASATNSAKPAARVKKAKKRRKG